MSDCEDGMKEVKIKERLMLLATGRDEGRKEVARKGAG